MPLKRPRVPTTMREFGRFMLRRAKRRRKRATPEASKVPVSAVPAKHVQPANAEHTREDEAEARARAEAEAEAEAKAKAKVKAKAARADEMKALAREAKDLGIVFRGMERVLVAAQRKRIAAERRRRCDQRKREEEERAQQEAEAARKREEREAKRRSTKAYRAQEARRRKEEAAAERREQERAKEEERRAARQAEAGGKAEQTQAARAFMVAYTPPEGVAPRLWRRLTRGEWVDAGMLQALRCIPADADSERACAEAVAAWTAQQPRAAFEVMCNDADADAPLENMLMRAPAAPKAPPPGSTETKQEEVAAPPPFLSARWHQLPVPVCVLHRDDTSLDVDVVLGPMDGSVNSRRCQPFLPFLPPDRYAWVRVPPQLYKCPPLARHVEAYHDHMVCVLQMATTLLNTEVELPTVEQLLKTEEEGLLRDRRLAAVRLVGSIQREDRDADKASIRFGDGTKTFDGPKKKQDVVHPRLRKMLRRMGRDRVRVGCLAHPSKVNYVDAIRRLVLEKGWNLSAAGMCAWPALTTNTMVSADASFVEAAKDVLPEHQGQPWGCAARWTHTWACLVGRMMGEEMLHLSSRHHRTMAVRVRQSLGMLLIPDAALEPHVEGRGGQGIVHDLAWLFAPSSLHRDAALEAMPPAVRGLASTLDRGDTFGQPLLWETETGWFGQPFWQERVGGWRRTQAMVCAVVVLSLVLRHHPLLWEGVQGPGAASEASVGTWNHLHAEDLRTTQNAWSVKRRAVAALMRCVSSAPARVGLFGIGTTTLAEGWPVMGWALAMPNLMRVCDVCPRVEALPTWAQWQAEVCRELQDMHGVALDGATALDSTRSPALADATVEQCVWAVLAVVQRTCGKRTACPCRFAMGRARCGVVNGAEMEPRVRVPEAYLKHMKHFPTTYV